MSQCSNGSIMINVSKEPNKVDFKRCCHCNQVWQRCPSSNGGVFPWDDFLSSKDAPRMPTDEAKKLRNIFHILDKESDIDGSIPQPQVVEILRLFGANPTHADEKKLIAELDVNHDLFVSFREMCMYFAAKGCVQVESQNAKLTKLRAFLEVFDVNHDGTLSKVEFRKMLTHM